MKSPKTIIKFLIFSLLPTVFLLFVLEVGLRVFGLDRPEFRTAALPGEVEGLFRPDRNLFWSMNSNRILTHEGTTVRTNRDGLRSREITNKKPKEFRILSMGESSTFGVGVGDDETYSALLETFLTEKDSTRPYRVINAGVPAYSSFQSLIFLKTKGLKFEPDLILFYHEVNDYLPSSVRNSGNDEIGLSLTDKQIYHSRREAMNRMLISNSAIYRFLTFRLAKRKIEKFQADFNQNPLTHIGLPDIGLPPRILSAGEKGITFSDVNEQALPSRVSPEERLEILEEVYAVSRNRGIKLLIIHPSYTYSTDHTCLLTEFVDKNGLTMFDAHPVLHPPGSKPGSLFVDAWHPNPEGHRLLAQGLSRMIQEEFLQKGPK